MSFTAAAIKYIGPKILQQTSSQSSPSQFTEHIKRARGSLSTWLAVFRLPQAIQFITLHPFPSLNYCIAPIAAWP